MHPEIKARKLKQYKEDIIKIKKFLKDKKGKFTRVEVAQQLGYSYVNFCRIANLADIDRTWFLMKNSNNEADLEHSKKIKEILDNSDRLLTRAEVAIQIGITNARLNNIIKKHSIETKGFRSGKAPTDEQITKNEETLEKLKETLEKRPKELTRKELAIELDIPYSKVVSLINTHNLDATKVKTDSGLQDSINRRNKDKIKEITGVLKGITEKFSISELSELLGINIQTVKIYIRKGYIDESIIKNESKNKTGVIDKIEVKQLRLEEYMEKVDKTTVKEIAEHTGFSVQTIKKYQKTGKIDKNKIEPEKKPKTDLETRVQQVNDYLKDKEEYSVTYKDIREYTGLSESTIRKYYNHNYIDRTKINSYSEIKLKKVQDFLEDKEVGTMTLKAITFNTGVSIPTVKRYYDHNVIDRSKVKI